MKNMPRYVKIFLTAALSAPHIAATAAPDRMISMTAESQHNRACIFDGASMFVDLTLTNNSNETIGVPLRFLDQVGAHPVLIDNETEEKLESGAPPPADLSLRDQYTPIPPGGTFKVKASVSPSQTRYFREWMIDVTAKFTVHIPVKVPGVEKPVRQSASTSLRIIGRDKAELDDK